MFQCPGPDGRLIPRQWLCDGSNDCHDVQQSDERNCGEFVETNMICDI